MFVVSLLTSFTVTLRLTTSVSRFDPGAAGSSRQGEESTHLCSASISSLVIGVSNLLCFFPGVNVTLSSAAAAAPETCRHTRINTQ